jgi:hypothetical protein
VRVRSSRAPSDALGPARVSIAIQRHIIDTAGRIIITPECAGRLSEVIDFLPLARGVS